MDQFVSAGSSAGGGSAAAARTGTARKGREGTRDGGMTEDQDALDLAADWADISQGLKKDLGPQLHTQWIKPIQLGSFCKETGTLDLFLPTEFSANWVADRFADRLSLAWKIARAEVRQVRITAHPRASSGWAALSASAATALSPPARAASTFLTKVRMRERRLPLISARRSLRRMRLRACGVLAMSVLFLSSDGLPLRETGKIPGAATCSTSLSSPPESGALNRPAANRQGNSYPDALQGPPPPRA